jgi:hypothetical protein
MKPSPLPAHASDRLRLALALLTILACLNGPVGAYPPAPFHLFYGMLRDEYGTPINTGAEVIFETGTGIQIKTTVIPGVESAANYRLEVPMDSGLMAAPYLPTALRPTVPFQVRVRVGGVTYLPIEMAGDLRQLGQPSQRTRLNLTLGEDSDGDGLPDAWERLINPDISKVKPGDDVDKDGLTNLQEYFAGTYAFDPENGFALSIVGVQQGRPQLEFLAVNARTYTLLGSTDLKNWEVLPFRLSTEAASAPARASFATDSVQKVRIEAVPPENGTPPTYFRLKLQ